MLFPILLTIFSAAVASAGQAPNVNPPTPLAKAPTALERRLSFLENGNQKDEYYGYTPLIHAARKGDTARVRQLLAGGAEVNWTMEGGYDALMMACDQGHPEVVQLLLEKGADLKKVSATGATARTLAEQNGYPAIVELLKKAGGVPPAPGKKP